MRIDRSGDSSLERGGDQFGNRDTRKESAAGDVFARREAGRDGRLPGDAPDPRDRDDDDRDGREGPVREGLPKRFSMRHTRHYVDELLGDAPLRTVRELPISEIEAPVDEALNLEPLEESIREFGVIEPLLVARRDADYRVIAGMRRLRAARTVGLSTVPCLVQDVDDEGVQSLRMAVLDRVTATSPVIVSQLADSDAALGAFALEADVEPPTTGRRWRCRGWAAVDGARRDRVDPEPAEAHHLVSVRHPVPPRSRRARAGILPGSDGVRRRRRRRRRQAARHHPRGGDAGRRGPAGARRAALDDRADGIAPGSVCARRSPRRRVQRRGRCDEGAAGLDPDVRRRESVRTDRSRMRR